MSQARTRHHMYVAQQDDDLISIYTVDPETGGLSLQEDVAVEGGPAPLALSPNKELLYVGLRGRQEISTYRVESPSGRLSVVGSVPLQGEPVYVATDRTGRYVLSAYYYQSTAAVHAVDQRGVPTVHRARCPCDVDGSVESVRLRAAHREPWSQRYFSIWV